MKKICTNVREILYTHIWKKINPLLHSVPNWGLKFQKWKNTYNVSKNKNAVIIYFTIIFK